MIAGPANLLSIVLSEFDSIEWTSTLACLLQLLDASLAQEMATGQEDFNIIVIFGAATALHFRLPFSVLKTGNLSVNIHNRIPTIALLHSFNSGF